MDAQAALFLFQNHRVGMIGSAGHLLPERLFVFHPPRTEALVEKSAQALEHLFETRAVCKCQHIFKKGGHIDH